MNIQEKQEKEIRQMLTNPGLAEKEIEIRFGKFAKDGFKPGISYETFLRLDKFFASFCSEITVEHSVQSVHKDMRLTTYYEPLQSVCDLPTEDWEEKSRVCIKKQQIKKIDIKNYGLRFSLADETPSEWDNNCKPDYKKYQKRMVYVWGENIEFHLSKIKKLERISYEIEIEITPFNNKTYKNFISFLTTTFMSCYQHTNKIMQDRTYNDILSDYQLLVKSKKFIGTKAQTLKYERLDFDMEYAVSEKLDGQRKLLYFRKSRIIVLDGNNFLWVLNKDPLSDEMIEKYENSVFDCEYFMGNFYVFDTLYLKGKEVISDLEDRISIYKQMVNDLQSDTINSKPYYFSKNLYENVVNVLNSEDENITDGIILTPTVGKSPPLKFKDGHSNTVDFKIKKQQYIEGQELWYLYVYDSENDSVLYKNEEHGISGKIYVSSQISQNFADDTVVEFIYDKHNNNFLPVRSRFDKQKGNYIKVADDNILLDMYPFKVQWLKNKNMDEYSLYFYNIDRYKNYFRRCVLRDYKNTGNLMMYSCDNVNDIYKIIDNNIRNCFVLDEDEQGLLKERFDKISSNKTTTNFKFTAGAIPQDKYSMFFSFDETTVYTEEIIKLIKHFLKKNATLIIHTTEPTQENIVDSNLFTYTQDEIVCKNKTTSIVSQDLVTMFKNYNINLVEEVKYDKYYDAWKYNRNFLNKQETRYMKIYKYLILKNE